MKALTETEIKLEASAQTLAELAQHPLLTARLDGQWHTLMLYNQYYDTDDLLLDRHALALRVRRDGDQCIQTLKSRGHSQRGLSVRDEWDWYLDRPELERGLLSGECWPAALASLDRGRLRPLFRTDFQRTKGILRWRWQEQTVVVEAAFDRGLAQSDSAEDEICELELELREGAQEALVAFAEQLQSAFALRPCDISKAERGYRLLRREGER